MSKFGDIYGLRPRKGLAKLGLIEAMAKTVSNSN